MARQRLSLSLRRLRLHHMDAPMAARPVPGVGGTVPTWAGRTRPTVHAVRSAPFRYWGSKVRMAPWLIERFPAHDHFVEVCAGSAAVLAAKPRVDAETVNDTYGEVVNFFRVLQDRERFDDLVDRVTFTPYSQQVFREALASESTDETDQAYAFFVRMQMAVVPGKTGWSYGVKGQSTKKTNKAGRWAAMPERLRWSAERFERVQVTQLDAVEVMRRFDAPGVLLFVDPPYHDDTRPGSTGTQSAYDHDAFNHDAFLAAVAETEHASVAVTHYQHPLYDDALPLADTYTSYADNPNHGNRETRVEYLYLLDRSQ